MKHHYSTNIWEKLVCPYCMRSLEKTSRGAKCDHCRAQYGYLDTGSLDLRLKRPKKYHLDFEIETPLLPESGFHFKVLPKNTMPEIDFSNVGVPQHLTKELMSYFPRAKEKNSLMLDLGCGHTIQRKACEHCGFEYVGLDYDSPYAPILGDAQSLPFKENSFEFVLSIAVLEHIRYPFVMIREVKRVLKPHGKFIGTVAFLEPFHNNSFYHYTHLGTYNLLHYGGLKVEHVAPSNKWSVLVAQAKMSLFPKMPLFLSRSLVLPLQTLHKLWWRFVSRKSRKINMNDRILKTSGDFSFIATKI